MLNVRADLGRVAVCDRRVVFRPVGRILTSREVEYLRGLGIQVGIDVAFER